MVYVKLIFTVEPKSGVSWREREGGREGERETNHVCGL